MDFNIGVIGLGYVGLPLAVELGKQFPTVGYDINQTRIAELNAGVDSTLETTPEELASASQLTCTASTATLAACNIYIVTCLLYTSPSPRDS